MTNLAREIANKGLRNALDQFRISVVGGNHAGASIQRPSGKLKVGRSAANDLVLFADDIEQEHFRLELPSQLSGKIVLHAIQGAVEVNGSHLVQVGEFVEIRNGARIVAGNSEIRIARLADPGNFVVPAVRAGIVVVALGAALVAWNLVSSLAELVPASAQSLYDSISQPVSRELRGAMKSAGIPTTGKSAATVEPYVWTARAKLEETGLANKLRVSASADGSLQISGTVSEADSAAWNSFLRWYDGNPDFPQLIREVSRGEDKNDFPPLQSVWFGKEPTAFFKDGTIAGIGARIPGDWVVAEISKDSVILERDGSRIMLTF